MVSNIFGCFHPKPWGFMIQFDLLIFFKRVGLKPPTTESFLTIFPIIYIIFTFFGGVTQDWRFFSRKLPREKIACSLDGWGRKGLITFLGPNVVVTWQRGVVGGNEPRNSAMFLKRKRYRKQSSPWTFWVPLMLIFQGVVGWKHEFFKENWWKSPTTMGYSMAFI